MAEVQPIRDLNKLEEMKEQLKLNNYRDYFLFIFGINSGLRISDILKLKVEDVQGEYLRLRETKTKKAKRYKINQNLRREIDYYITTYKPGEWLFPSRKGNGPISTTQAHRVLKNASEAIGIDEVATHTMRKTYGYFFYKKTKDIAMLQELFNHSSPSITKRYIGITQDEIDEVVDDFSL